MKTVPYCVPDILNLVLETARMVSDEPFIHRKVLTKVMAEVLSEPDLGASSAELASRCLNTACTALGVRDPYAKAKARCNKAMLGLEKDFRDHVAAAPDRLRACLDLVLAGSAITDFGVLGRAELEAQLRANLKLAPSRDDSAELRKAIGRARQVLYILDSAGELVLDKLLIEELAGKCQVTVAAASAPLLFAATPADAQAAGLDAISTIIDPEAAMLGLQLEKASSEFHDLFEAAEVVIVKGELNAQTLATVDRELYLFLTPYCAVAAAELGLKPGAPVLLRKPHRLGTGVYEATAGGNRPEA